MEREVTEVCTERECNVNLPVSDSTINSCIEESIEGTPLDSTNPIGNDTKMQIEINPLDIENKPEQSAENNEADSNENTGRVQATNYSARVNYNWAKPPRLLCTASKEYEPTEAYEKFTKGCQWSPDGTCLLTPSEDFRIRIYELPTEFYSDKVPSDLASKDLTAALTIKEGGLIYDSCWYPYMNSWDPATCCFLSTSKESPAHLWDAFTGELRATYRAYNQVDEVEASISVQFINTGREVWCGFKNALRTFDTERPGRQTNTIEFKKHFPNVSGLVSCIRENPIMPGLVAFGTYSKCIGLYKDAPLCTFKTSSGVTQIEFSPCGMKLFTAVRRGEEFLCWDLRNPGVILYSLGSRQSNTNQRIQFAISSDGAQIISGGTDGKITVWEPLDSQYVTEYEDVSPKYKIPLSDDCINGIGLHKCLPLLATSSGQRLCSIENSNRDNSVRLWCVS